MRLVPVSQRGVPIFYAAAPRQHRHRRLKKCKKRQRQHNAVLRAPSKPYLSPPPRSPSSSSVILRFFSSSLCACPSHCGSISLSEPPCERPPARPAIRPTKPLLRHWRPQPATALHLADLHPRARRILRSHRHPQTTSHPGSDATPAEPQGNRGLPKEPSRTQQNLGSFLPATSSMTVLAPTVVILVFVQLSLSRLVAHLSLLEHSKVIHHVGISLPPKY